MCHVLVLNSYLDPSSHLSQILYMPLLQVDLGYNLVYSRVARGTGRLAATGDGEVDLGRGHGQLSELVHEGGEEDQHSHRHEPLGRRADHVPHIALQWDRTVIRN